MHITKLSTASNVIACASPDANAWRQFLSKLLTTGALGATFFRAPRKRAQIVFRQGGPVGPSPWKEVPVAPRWCTWAFIEGESLKSNAASSDLERFHRKYGLTSSSYPPKQQQDEQDQKDQSESAAGVVSPTLTVWPCRKCSDQHEDQDDKQYGTHDCSPFLRTLTAHEI